jgi:hypothetical protein
MLRYVMPERFPKASKIEDNERFERPSRYRTIERKVVEAHEDGSRTERWLECNGKTHRSSVQRIFPGERGEFDFVEEVSREESGSCDGEHN